MEEQEIIVRDNRRRGYFTVDNEFVDYYFPLLSDTAFRIYIALCRIAGKEGTAFPKQKTLAGITNRARQTVNEAVKQLEEFNLIKVQNVFDDDGRQLSNRYILIDKTQWIVPEKENTFEADDLAPPVTPRRHPLSPPGDTLHINKENIKEEKEKILETDNKTTKVKSLLIDKQKLKAGGGTSRLAVDCESDWNSTSSRKLKNEPTTRSVLLHKDIIKDNNLKRENKNYKTKQNSTTKTESFLIDKQAVKESKRSLFGRPRSSTPQKKIEYKKKGGTYAEDVI